MRAKQPIMMAMLVVLTPIPSMASTFFVAADGTGDVPTIEDGINASADGDTILLGNGVFSGDGNRDLYIFDKGLVIRSMSGDPAQSVIDCGGGSEIHTGFVWETGSGTSVLQGISITAGNATGALSGFGSAVYVRDANSLTITRCFFYDNVGVAVRFRNQGAKVIENCALFGNFEPGSSGAGAVSVSGFGVQIVSCTISGNRAPAGAISLASGATLNLERSVVWGNCATLGYPYHEIFANDGLVQIHCSVVDSTGIGSFEPGHVAYGGDNVFTNPYFCDPAGCEDAPTDLGNYHVDAISPCLPPNNSCSALIGALGVNCTGATPTLETSWGAIKSQYRE